MSRAPEFTLTDPQQVIAALQRQLADAQQRLEQRTAERDEALAREAATAEVLGVINSSPGNLAPVFDAMLEKAMRLCDAAFGTLARFDGSTLRTAAMRGVPPEYARFRMNNPPAYGQKTAPGRFIAGERLIHNVDLKAEDAYREGEPNRRALVDIGRARTALQVALRKDDALLGSMTIYRQEVRPFTEKQIALLQNFAAQAVIAMENARLITETREALEQQTATAEVLQVINSWPGDLAPVFEAMLQKALALCGAAFGQLATHDGERFHTAATRGVPAAFAEYRRSNPPIYGPGTTPARILAGERVIRTDDLKAEPAYQAGEPNRRALVDLGGARSAVIVGLRKDDAVLGFIQIYRQEVRPFSDRHVALLESFAAQAVIAMENARLITETREALEQQTATAEVLQVINSSPGDLAPVFSAILEKAHTSCGTLHGSLQLYDGESLRAVATQGVAPEFAEVLRRGYRAANSPASRALISGERFVQISDSANVDHPVFRSAAELAGIGTVLFVPLVKEGTFLGLISAARREIRPFTDKQIALLQNFAAQAVIAMENARLLTETRDALEQQTAAAEVLGVINSSPGDLRPVFDAILEKAHSLCGADFGGLLTYDGEFVRLAAERNLPPAWADVVRGPWLPRHDHPVSRIMQGERLFQIHDMAEIARTSDDPVVQAAIELGGIRSLLLVPLRKEDAFLGYITAYRQEVRPFTNKQIELLENFAAQAVIAMENARLLGELRERTNDLEESLEYQTATSEVLKVISQSTFDLKPVLETVAETAARLCASEIVTILRRHADGYRVAAARGWSPEYREFLENHTFAANDQGTLTGRVARECRAVQVADITADPTYALTEAATLGKARTQLGVPLLREDAPIGVIIVSRQRVEPFTEKQIELVTTFADQAVIAIENARLLGELRQRTTEVAELNRGLEARVADQVEELGRVGRLKRFLAPQLAELIVSQGDEKILESHRREIVVVFCDLRGYTAFTETAEPEEVLDFLREYHGVLGPLVSQFEGTLDQFSGDGIMVFFNDPVPVPDPAERAVKMAVAMREAAGTLIAAWRRRGRDLGFGAGIAQGYATLGQIGFAERSGYTAIGTVCNLASRLCAEAKDGQILIAQRVAVAVEQTITLEEVGSLTLKGLTQPVVAFNVPAVGSQPALRVIEGGPQSV